MTDVLRAKDFWGGLMLIGVGLAALVIARDYALGTAFRMGPGYFPTVLGGIVALFGLHLVVRALRGRSETIEKNWSPRALIVLPLAFVLFGLLIDRAGFIPSLAVLIFASAATGSEFRLLEVAALTAALTLACVTVFIWGLGLPYPLIAGW